MLKWGIICALSAATPVWAECRQALALGLDISGSVDAREYQIQLDGVRAALLDTEVQTALLSRPSAPVDMVVYEWSGLHSKRMITRWTSITSAKVLATFAAQIQAHQRMNGNPTTALGSAILFGDTLLKQRPDCWSHTLDISGDGENNAGPRPREVHAVLDQGDITVNALVIINTADLDSPASPMDLATYFRAEVIHGAGAFVQEANGFADYKDAMVLKLLRELQGMNLSQLTRP